MGREQNSTINQRTACDNFLAAMHFNCYSTGHCSFKSGYSETSAGYIFLLMKF